MCRVNDDAMTLMFKLREELSETQEVELPLTQALYRYALLVTVLDHEVDRAIVYLKDCNGSPEHAKGRLLLRAAERALREAGDIENEATRGSNCSSTAHGA